MWQATSGSGSQSENGGDNLSFSGSGSYADSGSGYTASGSLGETGSQTDTYSDTVNLTLSPTGTWSSGSGSGSCSCSGSDDTSYSGGGTFTDASDNISGTFTENGWDNNSYNYGDTASCSGGLWTPTSGSGSDTDTAGDQYSYTGSGSLVGTGGGSGFTVTSGTQTETGGDTDSYSDTAGYYVAPDGTWDETSGSGSASDSGSDDWSYSESGTYAATDGSLSGTFSENGSDDASYGDNLALGYSGGAWSASSGSGSVSDSGGNGDSYNLSGSFTDSGTGFSATGADSVSGSDHVTFGDTANYWLGSGGTWNEGSDSGWASGGGSFNPSATGGGSYSGTWADLTPPISADRPPGGCSGLSFQAPNGTATAGTFQASGNDNVTYGFNVSGSGYAGSDTDTGTLTETDVGSASDSYAGSGSYCGTSGSGTVNQSGNDTDSYNLTTNYGLASDGSWQCSGGSGTDTGGGTATAGYSGGGSCWQGPTSGNFQSGDGDTSTGYSLGASCDSSGNWTATSGTGNGTDSGSSFYGYYGNGSYWGPPSGGTLTQDDNGGLNYNDSAGYTLAGGNWLATSGSGTTSGSDYAYSSYSGSGVAYSRSDGMTYTLSGTVYPNGYQSASDTFQTALGVDAQGNWISTSGSGSVHQEGGNACTYSGSSGSVGYSWFDGTASEHGSQYDSQGQTQAWTLASGAWSASGSPQAWTSAGGESAYNFSASGGAITQNDDHTITDTDNFNEQVASDTLTQAGSASGSGTATYTRTDSYAAPYSSWSTSVEGTDGWSKPTYTAQNYVTGQDGNDDSYDAYQSAPGFASQTYYAGYGGQNLNGIGTPPSNADGGYGPDSFAGPDCEISPVVGCQLSVVSSQSFLLAGEGQGVRAFGAGIGAQAGTGDWGLGIGGGGLSQFSSDENGTVPLSGAFTSDAAGNLTSLTDANGGVTRATYDPAGNLSSLTDPVGNATSFLYDGQGRLTQETDALGASRYFTYDNAGNLAQYTDRNGQIRQFGYDSSGNLASETWYATAGDAENAENPENTIQYTHDSAGRITSESDNNTADTYTYNDTGELTSTTESSVGGPTVTLAYQYNPAGERTEMAATIDGTADFVDDYAYNSLGQVVSVTQHAAASPLPPGEGQGEGGGLSPVSGGLSQVSSDETGTVPLSDETGTVPFDPVADVEVDFAYNTAGEVSTVSRYQDGQLAVEGDYSYDSLGRLVGLVYHQGTTTLSSYAWTYSGDSAVASASPLAPWSPTGGLMPAHDTSGVTDALMSGGLAGVDLVTSCTSNDGTASYAYDPTGQLVGATYTGGQDNEAYSYDANGNRTSANGSTYTTGADDRLLSDGTYTYQYDAEGNRTERVDIATGAVTSYTWDARDRLTSVTDYAGGLSQVSSDETGTVPLTPTQTVSYVYDPENRLVEETVTSAATAGSPSSVQSTYFVYDGNQIVLQFQPASVSSVPSVVDSSALPQSAGQTGPVPITGADLTHRYLWQPNAVDQVLADEHVTNPQSTGNVVWPLADNLGTVRDLAVYNAATGLTSVANHRVYDSFGNLKSQTNAAVDCLFGFTGRPFDPATGLQNNLNRWYDPNTGNWLTQDPTGFNAGDTNLYRYCGNSPASTETPAALWFRRGTLTHTGGGRLATLTSPRRHRPWGRHLRPSGFITWRPSSSRGLPKSLPKPPILRRGRTIW